VVDGPRDLGRVARLLALPSCEVLEVTGASEPFLVPLVRDAVRQVDVEAKVIDIDVAFLGDTVPPELAEEVSGTPDPEASGRGLPQPASPAASQEPGGPDSSPSAHVTAPPHAAVLAATHTSSFVSPRAGAPASSPVAAGRPGRA
jgi:hypothetical protein